MLFPGLNRRELISRAALLPAASLDLEAEATQTRPAEPPKTLTNLYVPRLQLWGFDNRDPIIHAGPLALTFQILTTGPDENSFGLDRAKVKVAHERPQVHSNGRWFRWCGTTMDSRGQLPCRSARDGRGLLFHSGRSTMQRSRSRREDSGARTEKGRRFANRLGCHSESAASA